LLVNALDLWSLRNPNFNPLEFEGFRKEAGLNAFTLSPTRWIEATNAIGIIFTGVAISVPPFGSRCKISHHSPKLQGIGRISTKKKENQEHFIL